MDLQYFKEYLNMGYEHILDPNGYDHILFVIALAIIYKLKDWKRVAILITAFTIGHCVTLALSSLSLISINSDLVETLIPITIILTCIYNIISDTEKTSDNMVNVNYLLALGFGLIHGLGYSNYFKAIVGKEESIVYPLLAFNIGVEIAQLLVMLAVLVICLVLSKVIEHKIIKIVVSAIIGLWAAYLLLA